MSTAEFSAKVWNAYDYDFVQKGTGVGFQAGTKENNLKFEIGGEATIYKILTEANNTKWEISAVGSVTNNSNTFSYDIIKFGNSTSTSFTSTNIPIRTSKPTFQAWRRNGSYTHKNIGFASDGVLKFEAKAGKIGTHVFQFDFSQFK
ncbi:hypothetical protein [Litorilituus sediminis]|uniref:Uncharacterized protein n=1 Tax=Litorilituus sediminis TaxID=718192 RepID=A0A4V0ZG46_9GAMM|nr:hypothetical protein [Litorilituus sediminis]QBG36030.1 hypothetical protein EMK97_10075 [Litorilituus sediminis]